MRKILILMLFAPALGLSQNKNGITFQAGAGYLFYPGSSADVQIASAKSGNPLNSGFTFELAADKRVNSFLDLGLGSSFNQFKNLEGPYVPFFADIRVIAQGKYKLFSFLNPGYGIYQRYVINPISLIPGDDSYPGLYRFGPVPDEKLTGGFYIAYGLGVIYKMIYLQAKYNWLHFKTMPGLGEKNTSNAYGVAGITFGLRFD